MVQFNTVYRSPLVRIATWRCEGHSRTPGEPTPSREHTFAFVTAGLFRRHLGRAEVLAAPGDALFFPGDTEYRTSHPCEEGDRGVGVRVDGECLEEILDRAGLGGSKSEVLFSSRAILPPRAILRLRRLVASLDQGEDEALAAEETTLLLLGEVAERLSGSQNGGACRPSTRCAHQRAVDRAIELVQARYHEKLLLEEIAREAAYSPYYFCRVFKNVTGISIHGYLKRQRLLAAMMHLESGAGLAQLAARTGFASHSHLTQQFHKEYNLPPTALHCLISVGTATR